MKFSCEDLSHYGLVLVPPSAPAYASLLADIERRLQRHVEGAPPLPEFFRSRIEEEDRATSAILLNQSRKDIAALWAVWQFETVTGRSYTHSRGMLSAQHLLLPFGLPEKGMKRYRYWNTILPGSKRYLGESGMVGDNTDVRLPDPDEEWRGGIGGCRSGGGGSGPDQIKHVRLVLDSAFFADGECVGPDRSKLYEQIAAQAEAHMLIGKIARNGHDNGLTPREILAEIEKVTGAAPERPIAIPPSVRNPNATEEDFRKWALQNMARRFEMQEGLPQYSEQMAVHTMMSWTGVVLPKFRKG
jgi:hypothetical protein